MQLIRSRLRVGLVVVLLVAVSCNKEYPVIISGGDGPTTSANYSIETEPTLSPDGQFLYYIAMDTLLPEKNGVYCAQISAPRREQLLAGAAMHSPSASFDRSTVAFLAGGVLNYLDAGDESSSPAGVPLSLQTVIYINDSMLVGCSGTRLYLVNSGDSTFSEVGTGTDPTFYAPDQFIALLAVQTGSYLILKFTVRFLDGEISTTIDTLDALTSNGRIRWVSLDPGGSRYVYVEQLDEENRVTTGQVGSSVRYSIATTDYLKPCMLGFNKLIYSGPDGRFYQSTFDGSTQSPFWHAEDVE